MRLTWVGHSTVVLDVAGVRLLTDPLLRRHAGALRRAWPAPDPAVWQAVDAVLVSHLHHDHAELASLRMLPDVPVLALPAAASWLRRKGVRTAVALDVGQTWSLRGVEVAAVEAEHRHRPMPHRPSDACGHVVSAPGGSTWLAGDTELFGGLEAVPAAAGSGSVDVAVVPVGGWGPHLSPGHLDPDAAAQACARVGATAAVPVHWGTLHPPGGHLAPRGWMRRPGPAFAAALAARAPGCRAVVLHPGQSTTL